MSEVLARMELAEPEDVDRLLELLAQAPPPEREMAVAYLRCWVPLPAVIEHLERDAT